MTTRTSRTTKAALRSRAIGALAGVFVGDALAEVADQLRWVDGDEATGSLMGRSGYGQDADATRESLRAALQDAGDAAVARGESDFRAAFMLFLTAVYRGHRFTEPRDAERFLASSEMTDVFRVVANSEQRHALAVLTLPLVIASADDGPTPREIAEGVRLFACGDPEIESAMVDYATAAHEAVVLGRVPDVVRQYLTVKATARSEAFRGVPTLIAPFDRDHEEVKQSMLDLSSRVLAEGIAGHREDERFERIPRALGESITHRIVGSATLPTGMPTVVLSLAAGLLGSAALPGALVSLLPVTSDDDPLWLTGFATDQILGPEYWNIGGETWAHTPTVVPLPDDAGVAFTRHTGVAAGLADDFDVVLMLTALPGVRPHKVQGKSMVVPWDFAEGRSGGRLSKREQLDFRDGADVREDDARWRCAQRVADLVSEYRRRGLTVAVDTGDSWEAAYNIALHCHRELDRRDAWPEMLYPEILVGDIGEPPRGYREGRLVRTLISLYPELEHVYEGYSRYLSAP